MKTDNELIADFLGWKLIDCSIEHNKCFPDKIETGLWSFQRFNKKGNIIDHDGGGDCWSWDEGDMIDFKHWHRIMPILVEIELMGYNVVIRCYDNKHYCNIMQNSKNIALGHGITKLDAIYNLIIEFIKWYNEKEKQSPNS